MVVSLASPDLLSASRQMGADPAVVAAVRNASLESGSRFDLLLASAKLESGFQPGAKAATSSASGLYQFTEQTWLDTMRRHGAEHGMADEAAAITDRGGRLTVSDPAARQRILDMRNDPAVASAMAADHLNDISAKLSAGLGRSASPGEIYLGHFLGVGGAKQMLSAPADQGAATVLPDAARANAPLFYTSDGTPLTVRQFLKNVQNRVDQAMAGVGAAVPSGPMTLADRAGAGKAADAPDAGASGWGTSTPRKNRTAPERMMLASLAETFARLDHSNEVAKSRRAAQQAHLPTGMLTTLQMTGLQGS